jgi:hypothetical protein
MKSKFGNAFYKLELEDTLISVHQNFSINYNYISETHYKSFF